MAGKAPKLSAFGQMVEDAFGERDVLVGQPQPRRALIADLEAQGITADEFRLVMRWWDRQTGFQTDKPLRETLANEERWRDVVRFEQPRRDREEARKIEAAHYPGMPAQAYDTNPLTRELRLSRPFDARAVLAGWLLGIRPVHTLAYWAGWDSDLVAKLIDAAELQDWNRRVHLHDDEALPRINAALAKVREAAPALLEVRGA